MKRREFLKNTLIVSTGIAALPGLTKMLLANSAAPFSYQNAVELFGISEREARLLLNLALSKGADFADLFCEYHLSSSLRMEEDQLKDVSHGIVTGVGIRAVKGDQIGYAYSEELEFEQLRKAAITAANIASQGGGSSTTGFQRVKIKNLYPVKQNIIEIPLDQKIALIERANQTAHRYHSKIAMVTIAFFENLRQILYYNSEGKVFHDQQPLTALRVYTVAEDGSNRQGAGSARSARHDLTFYAQADNQPETIATEAAQVAIINLDAKPAPSGAQVVVLGPAESGVLIHEAVGHGLEADYARKNLSNYSNRVGQKVAAPDCTIIDSGLFPHQRGAINVDDEGNLPTETILIENGILRGYMHDRISAKAMEVKPTGNGRRQSYAHPPQARMTNTYLKGGRYTPEEIIASVKYGVYAKQFSGGQVDITKGDFTFGVTEAYLIEDGKLTAPLKDVTLIGNGPDVMTKIMLVGNDLRLSSGTWTCGKNGQSVPVGVGNPTVKISAITVGGTR